MACSMFESPSFGLVASALVCLSLLVNHVFSMPGHAATAKVLKLRAELDEEYDYIVVGGGTAGLTVADRLSEVGESTVLVIEYGYLDDSNLITATGPDSGNRNAHEMPRATRYYNLTSVPQPSLDGQPKGVQAGCVVGGSSAVNGMIFDRGSASDYDAWVWSAGAWKDDFAREWGWDKMLPYFRKSVTFHPPDGRMRDEYGMTADAGAAYGGSTPVHSSYSPWQWPVQRVMWEAWRGMDGVEFPVEHADGHAVGVFWFPNSIDPRDRTRSYARLGHYSNEGGAHERENYHLLTAHRVTQVLMDTVEDEDGKRAWEAIGVMFTPRDGEMPERAWTVKAKKEVILSAGSIHTPQILQRSGIGPRDVLEAAGVDVKVELPGVGWNFQDHTSFRIGFSWGVDDIWPSQETLYYNETFAQMANELWETNKTGPHAAFTNSGAFLPLPILSPTEKDTIIQSILSQPPSEFLPPKLHPTLIQGYTHQLRTLAHQLNTTHSALLEMPFSGTSSSFALINLKPLSRGTIYLSPTDDGTTPTGRGDAEPIIDYRALTNPLDLRLNKEILKYVRRYFDSPAMRTGLDPTETSPRYEAESAEFEGWLRRSLSPSVAHPVGTCRMGPVELGGVVDAGLGVWGTRGLSVADCSVMPLVPGTHTSSTAYAIGEKAADLVKRRNGQSVGDKGEGKEETEHKDKEVGGKVEEEEIEEKEEEDTSDEDEGNDDEP